MESVVLVLLIIVGAIATIEALIFGAYAFVCVYRKVCKAKYIERAHALSEGKIYSASNKTTGEAMEELVPVLKFWETPNADEFACKVGKQLNERVKRSHDLMDQHQIVRKLRFVDLYAIQNNKSGVYRRWDNGGKEWRCCNLSGMVVEEYYDRTGNLLVPSFVYPTATVMGTMSRRLHPDDKKNARKKDKWGRVVELDDFYIKNRVTTCPSCGANLPTDCKDIICPFCSSTMYSDYFDWQVEVIEIEPVKPRIRGLIGWIMYFCNQKIDNKVNNKTKEKIVRFSENDFRNDIYESLMKDSLDAKEKVIDLWLGDVNITKVTHTEDETHITAKVNVNKTLITGERNITKQEYSRTLNFRRCRYPNKFDPNEAGLDKYKQCPTCGSPFAPDSKGNCNYCGGFLFMDKLKWNREV